MKFTPFRLLFALIGSLAIAHLARAESVTVGYNPPVSSVSGNEPFTSSAQTIQINPGSIPAGTYNLTLTVTVTTPTINGTPVANSTALGFLTLSTPSTAQGALTKVSPSQYTVPYVYDGSTPLTISFVMNVPLGNYAGSYGYDITATGWPATDTYGNTISAGVAQINDTVSPPAPSIVITVSPKNYTIPAGQTGYAVPYDIEGSTPSGTVISSATAKLYVGTPTFTNGVVTSGTVVPGFAATFYGLNGGSTGTGNTVTTNLGTAGTHATTNVLLPAGTYTLVASDTNNYGGTFNTNGAQSATFTVRGGISPTVTINTPANGATFVADGGSGYAAIPYSITASITSGYISSASDSMVIAGTSTAVVGWVPNFAVGANYPSTTDSGTINLPPGSYTINATATSDAGAMTSATAVTFKVIAAPTVTITGPANGQVFEINAATNTAVVPYTITGSTPAGSLFPLISAATATLTSSTGGVVTGFLPAFTLSLLSTTISTGGSVTLGVGTYTITASVVNNFGATATASQVTFTVVGLPTISITGPANGKVFEITSGGTAAVPYAIVGNTPTGTNFPSATSASATLTATNGGSAAPFSATFVVGSTSSTSGAGTQISSIGTVNLIPGTYTLNATETNNLGGAATATAVTFTVVGLPAISITAPANNAVISAGTTGNASVIYTITGGTPTGTGLSSASATLALNGSPVTTFFPNFSGLPSTTGTVASTTATATLTLAPGTYTINASETNNFGALANATQVTFTVIGPPTISITGPANGQVFSVSDTTGTAAVPYTITGGTPNGSTLSTAAATLSSNGSAVAFSPVFSGLPPSAGTSTTATGTIALGPGTYTINASDTNNIGGSATATQVTFTVTSPPNIAISAPANGSTIYIPIGSTVASVPYTIGGTTPAGTIFPGPASATATMTSSTGGATSGFLPAFAVGTGSTSISAGGTVSLGVGTYTINANDSNNDGGTGTAAPVTFAVAAATTPTIAISAPINGQVVTIPTGSTTALVSYTITGNTPSGTSFPTSSSGTAAIAVAAGGAGSIAGVTQPVFTGFGTGSTQITSTSVVSLTAGTYTITASDVNNTGGTATATPVTFTVVGAVVPTIAITAPANGATITIPSGGTTAAVTYTIGGTTPSGSTFTSSSSATATLTSSTGASTSGFTPAFAVDSTSANISTTGTVNLGPGTYTINATDTNNQGGKATATPVTFTVAGGTCSAPTVTTTGAFTGSVSCGSKTLWFNSTVNVSGLSAAGGILQFNNSTVTFTVNGAPVTLVVPSAIVSFSTSATQATSAYDATSNTWNTVVPAGYTGNVFLTGLNYAAPSNFSTSNNTVTWTGSFLGSAQNMSVQWLWTATVQSQTGTNYNTCGVKPVDLGSACQYNNTDYAGTCENYKSYNCGTACSSGSTSSSSTSTTIPGLYATGVGGTGALLAGGGADTHYLVTASSMGSKYLGNSTVDPQSLAWGWVPNTSSAQWITAPGGVNIGNGAGNNSLPASGSTALTDTWDYTVTFTMPANATLGTASIAGTLSADDTVTILVNGVVVTSNVPKITDNQYNQMCPFTLNAANATFQQGVNTIVFRVANENTPTPNNPSGLYVQAISGTVSIPKNVFPVTYCANLSGPSTRGTGAPPVITVGSPSDGSTVPVAAGSSAAVPVAFTAVSPTGSGNIAGISATLNGTPFILTTTSGVGSSATATGAASLSLAAGTYTFVVTGTNAYGSATATAAITVLPVAPPTITITAPNDGSTVTIPVGACAATVPYTLTGGTTYGTISSVAVTVNGTAVSTAPTLTGLNTAGVSGVGTLTLSPGTYAIAATDSNGVASATDTNTITVVKSDAGGGHVCGGGANGNEYLTWVQQNACSGQYGYDFNNGCNQTTTGGSIVPIAFSIFSNSTSYNNCWGWNNCGTFVTDTSVVIAVYEIYSDNSSSNPTLYTYSATGPNPPYYSIANNQYLLEFPTASGSHHYQVEVYSGGNSLNLLGAQDIYTQGSCMPSSCGNGSNFNGTPIAKGNCIWFNSVVNVSGLSSHATTLWFDSSAITFTCGGIPVSVNVPAACVKFDPNCTTATTVFNAASNCWVTTVPLNYGGNVFLCGATYQAPSNLPGGINPVNWTGCFRTDTGSLSAPWQWAAAVYTQCSTNLNALGVKAVDANNLCAYRNSDNAGTPEACKTCVTSGARGTGGSNWTGSYTGTVSPSVGSSCWLDSSWNSNNSWGGWGWGW